MTLFSVFAPIAMTSLPISVEPVKASLSTPGLVASSRPTSVPWPVIMLRTPGGTPASKAIFPYSRAVRGVYIAGLRTIVLPAARAGATFHTAMSSGKFHGRIPAHTPLGSLTTRLLMPMSGRSTTSSSRVADSRPKCRVCSIAIGMSAKLA